jgi:hypothetical protein
MYVALSTSLVLNYRIWEMCLPAQHVSIRLLNKKTIVCKPVPTLCVRLKECNLSCSVKLELSKLFWDAWHIVVTIRVCLVLCVGTLDSFSGLYILLCGYQGFSTKRGYWMWDLCWMQLLWQNFSVFSVLSLFWKNKRRLMRSPCCLSILPINFKIERVMAPESRNSEARRDTVLRERLVKHVPSATNTHATV